MSKKKFTHVSPGGQPQMVNVSEKKITTRTARAQAIIHVGEEIISLIQHNELITKKGPVFQTAIIAGVMGAKKTAELIPFCHPLGLEHCSVEIEDRRGGEIVVRCRVAVHHRTGVEMEALTGATVAALTIYDMCKALSHDIEITGVRLLEKTGGKRTYKRATRQA